MKSKIIILLACILTAHAFAEDAPKNPCEQPVQPNRQASDVVVKSFNKHLAAYNACIKKFVEDMREISKSSTDTVKAQQAHDAAEAAIVEFNAFTADMKANAPEE